MQQTAFTAPCHASSLRGPAPEERLRCARNARPARPARTTIRATMKAQRVAGGGVAPSADQFRQYDGQNFAQFARLASQPGVRMVPIWKKLFSDQLTPVTAYRCLVPESELQVPSFLLESVQNGKQQGRYSFIGARPVREVTAFADKVTVTSYENGEKTETKTKSEDPWDLIRQMNAELKPVSADAFPGEEALFSGGWVGYGGYDTMRYAELSSLPFSAAPDDDRNLPDLHFGLYKDVVIFDHATKVIYIIHWVDLAEYGDIKSNSGLEGVHEQAMTHLESMTDVIGKGRPSNTIAIGRVNINTDAAANRKTLPSNMTRDQFLGAIEKIKHYIAIGDTFQTVFSQRFERWSETDPFSVYRALRIINPSPYMIYMQCPGCNIVASSPEILTKVEKGILTNRPLAGTRRRGASDEEDEELAKELLADPKDRSEHMMLVDLGRNDVGKVAEYGTVEPAKIMEVERYSHVMHLSSTVTGKLRSELSSWDALRSTLPAGTISGAPKIRSMQIIDELEPTKRGPYGGGVGYISFYDTMNMALALRTMVVPNKARVNENGNEEWQYFLQAGAGIVHESDPDAEYTETVNKAMALNRSIDLAETAFGDSL